MLEPGCILKEDYDANRLVTSIKKAREMILCMPAACINPTDSKFVCDVIADVPVNVHDWRLRSTCTLFTSLKFVHLVACVYMWVLGTF